MQSGCRIGLPAFPAGFVTMDKPKIILVGGGGHCRSCIDVIEMENRFQIAGIIERPEGAHGGKIVGYPILGNDNDLPDMSKDFPCALVTIGHMKTTEPRIRMYERLRELGFQLPLIVSPLAYISRHALVGAGTIVMHHVIVNACAKIGDNCILNNKALLEHDTNVGDNCHISTRSVLNGEVGVGTGTFIGSGSIVRENVSIGKNCIIGIGSRVIKNIADNETYID